jgi:outer membrane protein assembly factor BamB
MDSKQYNDEGDDHKLVFQDLIPEQPANIWQKSIIQIQQNWPPRWSKRHRLLLLTVFSGILVFFLIFAFIHPSTQQNVTADANTNSSTIAIASSTQMLSYANVIYIVLNQTGNNNSQLEAINAQTGKLVWSYAHNNTEGIKLVGNILYIQTDTSLVALDASNRKLLWQNRTFSDVYHWQADQGILFTTATNGIVTALNASTGAQLWQTQQPVKLWQVDHGIFYTTPASGRGLIVLNEHNGKQLWYNPNISYQEVIIDNGHFYLTNSKQQSLQAFDGRNDRLLWHFDISGKVFGLSVQNGYIFLSDIQKIQVEVLDGQTGKMLWQRPGTLDVPTKDDPNLTVISSAKKKEIEIIRTADGTTLSHFSHTNLVVSSTETLFSIENGIAFFLYYTQNGSVQYSDPKVIAIRISDGAPIWSSQESPYITQLQDNTIDVVSISSNSLLVLRANNGQTLWQHSFGAIGN